MADSYILNLFFEWILYQNYHTILFVIFVFEKLSQNLYFIFPGLAFKGTVDVISGVPPKKKKKVACTIHNSTL